MEEKTIAGIATALSNSGISIIRLSGDRAVSIADSVFKGKDKLENCPSHQVVYGHIFDQDEIIDEVIVLLMRAPKSYTMEDVVEIHCHGGIVVTRKILALLIEHGAVLSEPGEFTKRAYLNGRLDLSQAESVMDLIQSKSEYEMKAAVRRLDGNLSRKIKDIRNHILDNIARIESALDDPEHFDISEYDKEIVEDTKKSIYIVENLLKNASYGKLMKEGIQTVILGKPNVGKSSLLNYLIGEERAIVTDIAGTTRDTIEETIQFSGITLNMIDTAGIRSTDDVIEKIGVEKSMKSAEDADLVLYMIDGTKEFDEEDLALIQKYLKKHLIVLRNKCDLITDDRKFSMDALKDQIDERNIVDLSVKEGIGIDILQKRIYDLFYGGNLDFNQEVFISNQRQIENLNCALTSLNSALGSMEEGMPEDFFTIDLMDAYRFLGFILGEEVEDDLVNRIFSKFCMGK